MHLEHGHIPAQYSRYIGRKVAANVAGLALLAVLVVLSISVGAVRIPLKEVLRALFTPAGAGRWQTIVVNIRLPQALAAVVSGAGLAVSGVAMQSILRNPLGSPFTLGISNAAAFGAAFSVMILGTGGMQSSLADAVSITHPYITTLAAFLFSLAATGVILAIARIRRASPEVMVLAGVALGSLFTAGTMFLQYFADDVQLAAMVFWTFGDVGRASWGELLIISIITAASGLYFLFNRWNYNAVDAGDETAKGLGVPVQRIRLLGMIVASLVTATIIAFVGVIGFVGLICPHMVRRVIGDDHRFLIPGSLIAGGILLLAADTVARTMLAPQVLPVAILTAFMGAPLFIYLLVRGYRR
ncbi:MAG: iron ABC transporter permease [Spirochaetales bacterium]|nr:iron ABC transporter permease [Spirochaetales bacterium]